MNLTETPVTFAIIALNVLISLIGFSSAGMVDKMIMWPYGVKRNRQFYRFISSGFLHADFTHLFFNMFTFYFFGRNVEIYFNVYNLGGMYAYIALYLLALVISDIPSYLKHQDDSRYRSLGASGAVSAVVFAAIIFDPWSRIYLFAAVPLSAFLFAVLYIVYCIYMSRRNADNVNHDAHLWGALFGLIFTIGLIYLKNPQLIDGIIHELKNPSLLGR